MTDEGSRAYMYDRPPHRWFKVRQEKGLVMKWWKTHSCKKKSEEKKGPEPPIRSMSNLPAGRKWRKLCGPSFCGERACPCRRSLDTWETNIHMYCIPTDARNGKSKTSKTSQTSQKKKKHIIMYVHSVQFCMCKMQLFSGIDDIRDRSFLILKTIRTPREGYKAIICINNRRSGKRPDWRWMEII